MIDSSLWKNETEIRFFTEALRNFASPEQLFYHLKSGCYAYVPKNTDGEGQTLQSRNSLIGQFTEKWTKDLFAPIAQHFGLYAVNGVVCEEAGLTKRSNADLAFCTTHSIHQRPEDIKLIFEIKMSIVSNYKFTNPDHISFIGDYKTHRGNPALLRSDSMLKAIGKSINIRVSGNESAKIPIVILCNSTISDSYIHKVDFLKNAGVIVIQGFWSLNPNLTTKEYVLQTPNLGFQTIRNMELLQNLTGELLHQEMNYFSSMISKPKLGKFIRIANQENSDETKAEKFLQLNKRAIMKQFNKEGTKTSSFGTSGRVNHDASKFYDSKLYKELSNGNDISKTVNEFPNELLNTIIHDSCEQMSQIPNDCLHLMITSPPYNVSKDYDEDLSLNEYLTLLKKAFSETYRVLINGGRACINIANLGRKPYIPLSF